VHLTFVRRRKIQPRLHRARLHHFVARGEMEKDRHRRNRRNKIVQCGVAQRGRLVGKSDKRPWRALTGGLLHTVTLRRLQRLPGSLFLPRRYSDATISLHKAAPLPLPLTGVPVARRSRLFSHFPSIMRGRFAKTSRFKRSLTRERSYGRSRKKLPR